MYLHTGSIYKCFTPMYFTAGLQVAFTSTVYNYYITLSSYKHSFQEVFQTFIHNCKAHMHIGSCKCLCRWLHMWFSERSFVLR
jgi:hypothetical protein